MKPIRTILVAVDFDDASEAALDEAIGLAKSLGARIVAFHSVPFSLNDVPEEIFYRSPNASHRQRTDGRSKLGNLLESRRSSGVDMRAEMGEGIAWDAILGAARKFDADLVVLGTHGRKGLPRGILGSVAERVVRTSPVPVLTVHANVA
jgi:nucleotide-binding universal stress UspA family protein